MPRRPVTLLFAAFAIMTAAEGVPAAERTGGFRVLAPASDTRLPATGAGPDLAATDALRVLRARTDPTLRRGDVVMGEAGPLVYTRRGFVGFETPHALGNAARRQLDTLLGISARRARREAFLRDKIVVVVAAPVPQRMTSADPGAERDGGRAAGEGFSVVALTPDRPARVVSLLPERPSGVGQRLTSTFQQVN